MKRRIAVFTSSRGDLGSLLPVMTLLDANPNVDQIIVASGVHGSGLFGETLAALSVPNSLIQHVTIDLHGNDPTGRDALMAATATCMTGVGHVLGELRPDIFVVLGDRYELLGATAAAVLHRVPIAHLHGGEITEGVIDDAVRHAVTKLSHLHLCGTEEYARRVRSMGEEPWRVFVTGAPAISRLLAAAPMTLTELGRAVGVELRRPLGLLTYHPPTLDPDRQGAELDAILEACQALGSVVATYPGLEDGSAAIIERLRSWASNRPDTVLVETLGHLYPAALALADVVIGNSSSGIVEAPTFGIPVVNVGDRQRGRVRATSTIDVPGEQVAVRQAVERALTPEFRRASRSATNPYGDGHAADRVVQVLVDQPLPPLLHKRFVDQPELSVKYG